LAKAKNNVNREAENFWAGVVFGVLLGGSFVGTFIHIMEKIQ
jgi:hypothetical protein